MAGFAGFVFNLIFFGSVACIAGRLGYFDTEEEKAARRRDAMVKNPATNQR